MPVYADVFRRQPALIPALSVSAGIIAATFMPMAVAFGMSCVIMLAGIILCVVCSSRARTPAKALSLAKYNHVWVSLIYSAVGIFSAAASLPDFHVPHGGIDGYVAEGRVLSSRLAENSQRAEVEILDGDGMAGRIVVYIPFHILHEELEPGDIIRLGGSLYNVCDFAHGMKSSEGKIDPDRYSASLERRGISAVGIADDFVKRAGTDDNFSTWMYKRRQAVSGIFYHKNLSLQASAFLSAILTGDTGGIDKTVRDSFSDAGISHILALSGLHIGIIAAIFSALLYPLSFLGITKLRWVMIVVMIWAYAAFTGFGPSTVRASVMATCYYISLICERPGSGFNPLWCACLIILVADPLALYNPGFQLSCLSVFSLIAFSDVSTPRSYRPGGIRRRLWSLAATPLIAMGGSWVVSAFYFGKFPCLFLPVSIIVMPFLPLYMAAGLLFGVLGWYGCEVSALAVVLNAGYDAITGLSAYVSSVAGAVAFVPGLPTLWLWIAGVITMAIALNPRIDCSAPSLRPRITVGRAVFPMLLLLSALAAIPIFPSLP